MQKDDHHNLFRDPRDRRTTAGQSYRAESFESERQHCNLGNASIRLNSRCCIVSGYLGLFRSPLYTKLLGPRSSGCSVPGCSRREFFHLSASSDSMRGLDDSTVRLMSLFTLFNSAPDSKRSSLPSNRSISVLSAQPSSLRQVLGPCCASSTGFLACPIQPPTSSQPSLTDRSRLFTA